MDMTDSVYKLYHYKISADEDDDDEKEPKLIGVYSTRENAKAAIARLKDKPGFNVWPGGFRIYSHRLDRDGWEEGFINPYEDEDWPKE